MSAWLARVPRLNIISGIVSVRVFLDEINCLYQCGWASFNLLSTWEKNKKAEERWIFCLTELFLSHLLLTSGWDLYYWCLWFSSFWTQTELDHWFSSVCSLGADWRKFLSFLNIGEFLIIKENLWHYLSPTDSISYSGT